MWLEDTMRDTVMQCYDVFSHHVQDVAVVWHRVVACHVICDVMWYEGSGCCVTCSLVMEHDVTSCLLMFFHVQDKDVFRHVVRPCVAMSYELSGAQFIRLHSEELSSDMCLCRTVQFHVTQCHVISLILWHEPSMLFQSWLTCACNVMVNVVTLRQCIFSTMQYFLKTFHVGHFAVDSSALLLLLSCMSLHLYLYQQMSPQLQFLHWMLTICFIFHY